ncbi:class I SAM-dependent methyltransferase [Spirulina subsalsa FACHB-351]|uniref:Class I SAM-dependent methyltransferase n=1 Tax=Spirulina subsalsa FACHB-351 TaxID=234711 RepID=A0ABT3L9G1_9CYAN|nr:class I SAM-dependent methyltransferase [Spirulina subsalsa]MCW6038102.1 class I SAM-dependent methyltransferase [Spirulina subsalsa FACHB-351]
MIKMQIEDRNYKIADYLARSNDFYSLNKYQLVMNWLPKQEHLRVLNAGCGSGEMNLLLAQNRSWQVEAVDIDEEAVSLSKQLKEQTGLDNLEVFHSSIEDFKPTGYYDVIVSNDVLEHIKDDINALEKLCSWLKPGGYLCISVPAFQLLFGYHDRMLGHYRRYSRQQLVNRVAQFLQVSRVRYFGCVLIPVVLFYSTWLQKPYPVEQVQKKSFLVGVLQKMLAWEVRYGSPWGISLVLLARKF